MKHGESDIERQVSIQGIHLSSFWKKAGSFNGYDYISQTTHYLIFNMQDFKNCLIYVGMF